jgi:hypothetical protein
VEAINLYGYGIGGDKGKNIRETVVAESGRAGLRLDIWCDWRGRWIV